MASTSCQCILTALPRPPSSDRGNSLGPFGLVDFMCLINEDKLIRSWNSHFKLHDTCFCPSETHKGCSGEKGRRTECCLLVGEHCLAVSQGPAAVLSELETLWLGFVSPESSADLPNEQHLWLILIHRQEKKISWLPDPLKAALEPCYRSNNGHPCCKHPDLSEDGSRCKPDLAQFSTQCKP